MSILIFLLVSYVLMCFTLSLLFPKAGVASSKAWIPGVNFAEWCKLIGRKPIYALLLLVPILNIFIFTGMAVDLVRSFDKLDFKHTALAVIYCPIIFYQIAKNNDDKYLGPTLEREAAYAASIKAAMDNNDKYEYKKLVENNPYKKSAPREWVESIVFAVFAAAFIRMFLIEAYVIPTPSMEGSLNVGDFLFVSKAHYGIRTPSTIAMLPLLHNRVPFINTESYLESPSIKSHRLPAIEKIEVGKPIVFNWPIGDSIYLTGKRSYGVAQVKNNPGFIQNDRALASMVRKKEIITRPVDKRDHYIKRCIGAPGDSIQIIDRQVFVNGKAMPNPTHMQFLYIVGFPATTALNSKRLEEWGIDWGDRVDDVRNMAISPGSKILLNLDQEQVDKLKDAVPGITFDLYPQKVEPNKIFPNAPKHFNSWSVDNFGPIYIPKKGATVDISLENIALYQRIINVYENNDYEIKGGKIYINGSEASSYTFKQDYFWAMGDNRHNSEDSRMWGYVPHDHIVGKPLFIWFSTKEGSIGNGINWDRIMKSATSKQ